MIHYMENGVPTLLFDEMQLAFDELTKKQISALLGGKAINPALLTLDIREGVSDHEKAEMVESGLATAEDVRVTLSAAPDLDFAMEYFAACVDFADHSEALQNSFLED